MSTRFETDFTHYPLVVVTIPSQRVDDADVRAFIQGQRDMLARRSPHLLLCDARSGHVMPATQRKLFGDWLKEAEQATRKYTAGMAIVVDNGLIRGALTAVLWVVEPACPTKAVGTLDEGIAWLAECGERAGMANVREVLSAAQQKRRSA
ncbi:MAG: hypothetical protein KC593_25825 [Myxococcales bacterium]|nr:hypothetical protein [Myxococcales bacterium]MCB9626099.1 hypothetical protein [Sandaracinaceae bacterium]